MSTAVQKFLALLFIHIGVLIMFISSMTFSGESLLGLVLFVGGFVWLFFAGRVVRPAATTT